MGGFWFAQGPCKQSPCNTEGPHVCLKFSVNELWVTHYSLTSPFSGTTVWVCPQRIKSGLLHLAFSPSGVIVEQVSIWMSVYS